MERRLAAIVCADVAGYSRMMGADEAGTHATFKAHRSAIHPIILNHGGRVVKNTGDGFLLEFPSVVGAVEAAIAMQALMAERNNHLPADRAMHFRLGVHMGDVMADEDELFGDDVNIAVRLESVAAPGGVAISEKAYSEAGAYLSEQLVDAGMYRFKNIRDPIHVFTWEPTGSDAHDERRGETSVLPAQYRTAIVGVLPFVNLSGNADEYFADGLTEDLIHALSLQSFYRVLGRSSTFPFKGKAVSARLIAREIDATYLIQGSVRRAGSKIRVTAELIAPENGEQLWTGRYDRDMGDLFVLQREQIAHVPVISAGPELLAVFRCDQLGGDAYLRPRAPDRTLDQIGRNDLARDQARAQGFALERERRASAEHAIEGLQRKRMDQVLGKAVGKIFIGVAAEVDEGQNPDDCGSILRRQDRGLAAPLVVCIRPGRFPGEDVDRVPDVLETVHPGIDELLAEIRASFAVGLLRDRDASGGGDRFEANCDIDIVPEQFVLVGHHIAHVDAEPEVHGAIGGQMVVAFRHQGLHGDCSLDGADHAREFEQKPVAGIFHDAAAVIENDRMDRAAMGLERGMGAGRVGTHHARVTGDVSTDDGGKASFHTLSGAPGPRD